MPKVDSDALVNGLLNDPINFLRNNLLWIDGNNEGPPSRDTRLFEVRDLGFPPTGPTRQYTGGKTYDIIESQTGSLMAHYLPWNYDTGYYIILEPNSQVSVMFTGTLTGCAVGYVTAPDGALRLSHHNILSAGGSTNRQAMKDSLSFAVPDNSGAAIHPENYQYYATAQDRSQNEIRIDGRAVVVASHQPNQPWKVYLQLFQVAKDGSDDIQDFAIRGAVQM